jgi:hypothetical protein
MAEPVESGAAFTAGRPQMLFEGSYPTPNSGRQLYDASADSERFLMIKSGTDEAGAGQPQINIVLNWFEKLKERVPVP